MVEISCLTICNFCMSLYISYGRNDPRAKRPTDETTHLIRANRPTHKTRAKRARAKRPGETTHGRKDPDSCSPVKGCPKEAFWDLCSSHCLKKICHSTYHQGPQPVDIACTLLEEEEGKELVCTISKKKKKKKK